MSLFQVLNVLCFCWFFIRRLLCLYKSWCYLLFIFIFISSDLELKLKKFALKTTHFFYVRSDLIFIYLVKGGFYICRFNNLWMIFKVSNFPFMWKRMRLQRRSQYLATFCYLTLSKNILITSRVGNNYKYWLNYKSAHTLNKIFWFNISTMHLTDGAPIVISSYLKYTDLLNLSLTEKLLKFIDTSLISNILQSNNKFIIDRKSDMPINPLMDPGFFSDSSVHHLNFYSSLFFFLPNIKVILDNNKSYMLSTHNNITLSTSFLSDSFDFYPFLDLNMVVSESNIGSYLCDFLSFLIPTNWFNIIKAFILQFKDNKNVPALYLENSKYQFNEYDLRMSFSKVLLYELKNINVRKTLVDSRIRNSLITLYTLLNKTLRHSDYNNAGYNAEYPSKVILNNFFFDFLRIIFQTFNQLELPFMSWKMLFNISNNTYTPIEENELFLRESTSLYILDLNFFNNSIVFSSYYEYLVNEFYNFVMEQFIPRDIGKLLLQKNKRVPDVRKHFLLYSYMSIPYLEYRVRLQESSTDAIMAVDQYDFNEGNELVLWPYAIPTITFKKYAYEQKPFRLLSNEYINYSAKAYSLSHTLFAELLITAPVPYSIWLERWTEGVDSAISATHLRRIFKNLCANDYTHLWISLNPSLLIKYLLIYSFQHIPDLWFLKNSTALYVLFKKVFNITTLSSNNTSMNELNKLKIFYAKYIYCVSRLSYLDATVEYLFENSLGILFGRTWAVSDEHHNKYFLYTYYYEKQYCWGYSSMLLYFFNSFVRYSFIIQNKAQFIELFELCHKSYELKVPIELQDTFSYSMQYQLENWSEKYPGEHASSGGVYLSQILYLEFLRYLIDLKVISVTSSNKTITSWLTDVDLFHNLTDIKLLHNITDTIVEDEEEDIDSINADITKYEVENYDNNISDNNSLIPYNPTGSAIRKNYNISNNFNNEFDEL